MEVELGELRLLDSSVLHTSALSLVGLGVGGHGDGSGDHLSGLEASESVDRLSVVGLSSDANSSVVEDSIVRAVVSWSVEGSVVAD